MLKAVRKRNPKRIKKILQYYNAIVDNTREALLLSGVPNKLIFFYLFMPPKLEEMIPEDVVLFYREIRKNVVIYLRQSGFTQREISLRLGGSSYHIVSKILKEHEKEIGRASCRERV